MAYNPGQIKSWLLRVFGGLASCFFVAVICTAFSLVLVSGAGYALVKKLPEPAPQAPTTTPLKPPQAPAPVTPSPYYSTAPSAGVWGYFPLVTTDPNAITPSIHTGPHVADTVLGRVSPTGTVAVVCSVSGDFVDPVRWASTSDWDYITSPMPGWVSDALINTNGATAPRC